MIRTSLVVTALTALLVAKVAFGTEPNARVLNDSVARQFNYYDELDLEQFGALESKFGATSRVISSLNAVQFGRLEVRAKLVVPRSDEPRARGVFVSNDPEPVRVMLDYALVSCGNGCKVGVLTEGDERARQYHAAHERIKAKSQTRAPLAANKHVRRSDRVASMVVIDGDRAREAIQQINSSQRIHVFLQAAVHGFADFEFDTSAGLMPE